MESFCEAINCPNKDNFCLVGGTICQRKDDVPNLLWPRPGPTCDYLRQDGKAHTKWYSEQDPYHRTEIQIVAALVKSKNGK